MIGRECEVWDDTESEWGHEKEHQTVGQSRGVARYFSASGSFGRAEEGRKLC